LEARRFMTSPWPTLAHCHTKRGVWSDRVANVCTTEPLRPRRWQGRIARGELWHQLVLKPVPRTGNVGGFALVWKEWPESPNVHTKQLVPERVSERGQRWHRAAHSINEPGAASHGATHSFQNECVLMGNIGGAQSLIPALAPSPSQLQASNAQIKINRQCSRAPTCYHTRAHLAGLQDLAQN
jgi:hypothetical protein